MIPLIIASVILVLFYLGWSSYAKVANRKWLTPANPFPEEWRELLLNHVHFYNSLNEYDQRKFEFQLQEFLLNCKVTGVKTEIDTLDQLYVGCSAIIPVFGFDQWKYTNIREVLVYPAMFNESFELEGNNRRVLGMVGNQSMEGIMIISKKALRLGFSNESDKKNTAIHEFVHLIDKSDGAVDGIPKLLLEKQYVIPWINILNIEMEKIYAGKSDINPYGGTNRAEFFSVVSEYFFERPQLLQKKHPELYRLLEKIFNQKMATKKFKLHK